MEVSAKTSGKQNQWPPSLCNLPKAAEISSEFLGQHCSVMLQHQTGSGKSSLPPELTSPIMGSLWISPVVQYSLQSPSLLCPDFLQRVSAPFSTLEHSGDSMAPSTRFTSP